MKIFFLNIKRNNILNAQTLWKMYSIERKDNHTKSFHTFNIVQAISKNKIKFLLLI